MEIKNKIILITGATGGIGEACVKMLHAQDANLIVVGRSKQKLKQIVNNLDARHQYIVADISTTTGRDEIASNCEKHPLDILINLAGVMEFGSFENQTPEKIEKLFQTNLIAPVLLTQKIIPLLKKRHEAMIVNVGSIFGSIGHAGFSTYCASKFGLRGFTQSLRRELADTRIKVLYLAPRATATALNTDSINQLNTELKNNVDPVEVVAIELLRVLKSEKVETYMGWPEKLFVKLNALRPAIVDGAMLKSLAVIKKYFI